MRPASWMANLTDMAIDLVIQIKYISFLHKESELVAKVYLTFFTNKLKYRIITKAGNAHNVELLQNVVDW